MFFLYMREEYAVEDQHQHVVGGKNQRKGQKARLVATEKESSDTIGETILEGYLLGQKAK